MNRRFILISLILFIFCRFLLAQNPFIKQYTTTDGLPSNVINIIRPDSEKFLWFATEGGLVRYDGSSFKGFNTKDGLAQNQVLVIKEDSFKRVWFFCIGGQMNYFYQNKIYSKNDEPFLDSLKGNWTFVQDRQGNLYFFNYHSRRITVLDTNNHVKFYWLPIDPPGEKPYTGTEMNIQYMTRVTTGEYLIWTNEGIYKTSELSEKPVKVASFERYHNIFPLGDTILYDVIAYPESNSSVLIRYIDGTPQDTINFSGASLDDDCIILEDAGANLWISHPLKGIFCLHNKKVIFHADTKGTTWICKDHEGNIWANSKNGAFKISPYALYFKHFDNTFFQNEGVDALSADPDGQIWGLSGSRIFLYRDNEFYNMDVSNLNVTFYEIIALNYRSLLIHDYNANIYAFSGISASRADFKLTYRKAFPLNYVKYAANPVVNKNRDVVCLWGYGAVSTCSVKNDFQETDRYVTGRASYIFYDASGNLVVLDNQYNYILQNPAAKPCKRFDNLPKTFFFDHKALDSNADLFLTHYDSLYLVKNQKVVNLTSAFDYSLNTPVKRMTYQSPVLYLSTFRNIYTCNRPIDIQEKSALSLHLIDVNFSDIRDILAVHDSLYIASGDGLTIIPTEMIGEIKTKTPVPYFHSIKINDSESDIYSGEKSVKGRNKINIEFGSINYSQNRVLFSYKMEGYEKEWNVGTASNVVYANLLPGKYTFLLKAGKSNSPWSDPVDFEIHVSAALWQNPLFYAALLILLAGIITLYFIYRKNQQIKKRELEHQLVTLEQQALQSMMNPHFIFNTLGSIQNYLLQNKPGEAGLFLSQFARLIRLNINSIKASTVSLEDEINRLRIYLDLEKFRMENKFDYTFELAKDIVDDQVYIPSMLIQPYVENSVWHGISPLEGGGMIRVSFAIHSDRSLKVIIEDNGVGMIRSAKYSSKGENHLRLSMEVIRKRLEIIGKKMKVETSVVIEEAYPGSPDPGTLVTLIIPFSFDERKKIF